MTTINMSVSACTILVGTLLTSGAGAQAMIDDTGTFRVKSPFEDETAQAECPVDEAVVLRDLDAVIDLMKEGPKQAAACASFLDEYRPDWHRDDEAQTLVEPFLGYLLGDGVTRGMKRHADFINLLGHLQGIAPDWRLRDEVDAILEQAIVESVAQDPFVADFWRSAIEEADLAWRESDAAEAALPKIYELAVVQQQRTDGLINERPRQLLKELSWPSYARLMIETRALDTWPKRIALTVIALILVALIIRRTRRRKTIA